MNARALLYSVLLAGLLAGCETPTPPPVVLAEPPAQAKTLSQVAAAVQQLRTDNAQNPDGPAKQAVDLQARVAQSGLDAPTEADVANAAETSELVFAGRIADAEARAAKAEVALGALRKEWAQEQAAAQARIQKLIDDYESRLAVAHAEADKEAYLRVVTAFAIFGLVVSGFGIFCAVTGWSRIGVLCIPAGILLGGSGLLWGKPWFLYTVGGALLLLAVAAGIRWAVSLYERPAAPVPPASAPAPSRAG